MLARKLPALLRQVRLASAARGARSLRRELRALDFPGVAPGGVPKPKARTKRDRATGRNVASRWKAKAKQLRAEGASDATVGRRATASIRYSLDVAAITESSAAFTDARNELARDLADDGWNIWLRWIAEVDACKACDDLEGTEVEAWIGWTVSPGSMHPHCRCYDEIVEYPRGGWRRQRRR